MRKASKVFTVLVFLFLYLPMLVLAVASFNRGNDPQVFKGFTLGNYAALFQDGVLLPLLLNSVIVALISSLLATVLGTAATLGIQRMKPGLRRFTMALTNIPLTNPEIVTGVSLALLFAFVGQAMKLKSIMGFWTLLIAHVTFNLPYVILSVQPKLLQMDENLTEAALDLGCTPFRAFWKVILPEIMPGVIPGALLSFTMSLDDFIISYFTSYTDKNLSMVIYSAARKGIEPSIYALSTIMFLVVLALLLVINKRGALEDVS